MKTIGPFLFVFFACGHLLAQEPSLEALQKIYTHAMAKIDTQYQEKLKPLKNTYYQNLIKYLSQVKAKGDLKALVEVKAEEKRFLKENTVPANPAGGKNATIVKIQQSFNTSAKTMNKAKNKQVLNLMSYYIKRLNALKNQYVRQENIELAFSVQNELDRMKKASESLKASPKVPGLTRTIPDASKPAIPKSTIAPQDLILHYTFDENTSGNEVLDSSPSKNHGQLKYGKRIAEGVRNGALLLSREESGIRSTSPISITRNDKRTVSLWFYYNVPQSAAALLGWGKTGKSKLNVLRMHSMNHLLFHGDFTDHKLQLSPFQTKRWYHVAMTYDGAVTELFLDGVSLGRKKLALNTVSSELYLGSTRKLQNVHFQRSIIGRIDECMIWKRSLNADEIWDVYQKQGGKLIRQQAIVPKGAKKFNGHSYKYFAEKINWHKARKKCEKLGGYLATVQSKKENDFLAKMAQSSKRGIWLGGSDQAKERSWAWVTDEPFTFTNWGGSEPNNSHGLEDYLKMMSSGSWNDLQPEENHELSPHGYVCEWDK